MKPLLTFQEALNATEGNKRNLLLGNGFSIACKPKIFTYGSLYSKADFSKNPKLPSIFETLGTQDFETVINSLETSSKVLPIYSSAISTVGMLADSVALKEILIKTVTQNHPDGPFEIEEYQYLAVREFLSNFIGDGKGKVFTLNYDLLLYWAVMHTEFVDGASVDLVARDGFGDDDPSHPEDYVVWQGEAGGSRSSIFYLHGALHLFDDKTELKKFTWNRKDKRLKDQSWDAIKNGAFPLFVAEGTSESKMNKITHNAYLFEAYRTLKNAVTQTTSAFFIHGHSLADNDSHILKLLSRGRFPMLYVGLHGNQSSTGNQQIIKNARAIVEARTGRPLDVQFYDAASASVWG